MGSLVGVGFLAIFAVVPLAHAHETKRYPDSLRASAMPALREALPR